MSPDETRHFLGMISEEFQSKLSCVLEVVESQHEDTKRRFVALEEKLTAEIMLNRAAIRGNRESIVGLERRLTEVDERLSMQISEVDERLSTQISEVDERLSTQISEVDERLSTQISEVDERLSTQISEVDERLSTQISEVDERLSTKIAEIRKTQVSQNQPVCE